MVVCYATASRGALHKTLLLACLQFFHCRGFTCVPASTQVRAASIRPVSFNAPTALTDSSRTLLSEQVGAWNGTLSFPPCKQLLEMPLGAHVLSDVVTLSGRHPNQLHKFRVKLYPRGAGDSFSSPSTSVSNRLFKNKQQGGFGMSYRILPMFERKSSDDQRVGIFMEYLPDSPDDSVDATFSLRLKGNQAEGPLFDIEWRSGMRFVSLQQSKLVEGRANDFGAHLLQTKLLPSFAGGVDSEQPLLLHLEIVLHDNVQSSALDGQHGPSNWFKLKDIRTTTNSSTHDPQVRVGRIVVPILQRLSQRPRMFQQGAYPGVEYRIMRIADPTTDADLFCSRPGADYELKPIYPLVPQLERQWPIRINEQDIPKLYTPAMYNAVSAIGSLLTAVSGLVTAFVISQCVSLFVIPSLSMDPTLHVGDVLLVDKVTPRVFPQWNHKPGSVVLFHPPERLQVLLQQQSGSRLSDRDLFVKRVAAETGDALVVRKDGRVLVNGQDVSSGRRDLCETEPLRLIEKYIEPHDEQAPLTVPADQVAVLGDCGSVSIDSRVWGTLPVQDIVGRPIIRLWPLSRFGNIPDLPREP